MKVIGRSDNLCSRCGSKLMLVIEKTLGDGSRKIEYIYRCTGCRKVKILQCTLVISTINGSVKITKI